MFLVHLLLCWTISGSIGKLFLRYPLDLEVSCRVYSESNRLVGEIYRGTRMRETYGTKKR